MKRRQNSSDESDYQSTDDIDESDAEEYLYTKRQRLTLSNDPDEQISETCNRCLSLEAEDLFNLPDSSNNVRQIKQLGDLPQELSTSRCPMCRLLYAARLEYRGQSASKEYLLLCVRSPWTWNPSLFSDRKFLCVVRPPPRGSNGWRGLEWSFAWEGRKTGVIALASQKDVQDVQNVQDVPRSILMVQCVPSTIDNFGFIQRWIQACVDSPHTKCCRSPQNPPWPQNLALISCADKKVVHFESRVRYAALSYVWGVASCLQEPYLNNGNLSTPIPRAVEDAILVAQQCGIEHIWIDRYCIDQTDAKSKHHQIRQMDLIYRNAFLTIIDAAGTDPNCGLSGVSMNRPLAPRARTGSHDLVLAMPPPQSAIKMSTWYQRAWTYQEAFFSTRCLIFTVQQVYWECPTAFIRESLPRDEIKRSDDRLFGVKSNPLLSVRDQLGEYSHRQLSYQSDAIRAFAGIFHYFEDQKFAIYHHQGIPLAQNVRIGPRGGLKRGQGNSNSENLAIGLRWHNLEHGARRSGFPSWSWAGWESSFKFSSLPSHAESSQTTETNPVLIQVRDSKGNEINFDDYELRNPTKSDTEPLTRFIRIETYTIPITIKRLSEGFGSCFDSFMKFGWPKNISGHVAVFEDAELRLEILLYSNSCTYLEGTPIMEFSNHESSGEIIGLILGRHRNEPRQDSEGGVFVLLVQDVGTHFERVGSMRFQSDMMRLVPIQEPLVHDHEDISRVRGMNQDTYWQLCFGAGSRRSILLG